MIVPNLRFVTLKYKPFELIKLLFFSGLFLQHDDFSHDVCGVAVFARVSLLYHRPASLASFSPRLLKKELLLVLVRFLYFLVHFDIHSGTFSLINCNKK